MTTKLFSVFRFPILLALLFLGVWTARADGTPVVPASQAEVDAGVNRTKFVAPSTLRGVSQLKPTQFNAVTTNFLPPFTSSEWLSLNGMNLATYRNGEYWLCERTNQGLYWAWIPVPFGTTNIIASVTGRSASGSTTPNFGFYNSGWVDQKSPTFTTSFSSLTFTCNAAAITSGSSNILFAISCNNAIMILSNNISLQYFPPITDPVLSQPFTRYQVRPENYVGDAGIPSLGNGKPFAISWPNVDTSRVGSHSYVEFSTAATNVTLETMCWNSGSLSIYTNGSYYTNLSIGSPNPVCRVFPITLAGSYNTVRVYAYHASADSKASHLRAVYVPRGYGVQFANNEPQRRVWGFGDSILSGVYVSTGGYANDGVRIIESWMPLRWLSNSQGGQSLFNVWSNSFQKRLTVLDSLAEANPSDIWIQMGFNDWNNNTFSGTNNFRNAYLDAVQTFHQYAPRATIYCQQPLFTTWAGSSTGGLTIQQYRDAIASVAQQCSNYCVSINASTWVTSGDLTDQIHPTENGQIKYAANIAENLWTNRIVVKP